MGQNEEVKMDTNKQKRTSITLACFGDDLPQIKKIIEDSGKTQPIFLHDLFFKKTRESNCGHDAIILDLNSEIENLKSDLDSNIKEMELLEAKTLPKRIHFICNEMINASELPNVNSIEDALNHILAPYWNKGLFVPDESELNEFNG